MKAYFIDYTGTMVKDDEPYTRELLAYILSHSDFKSPQKVLQVVWTMIKEIEAKSYGENFVRNYEKVEKILDYCEDFYSLQGDRDYIHSVWSKIWVHAPLYDDVRPFFKRSEVPIYVLSNDDLCYLEESMKEKGLHPAGIISAEMARACKPSPKIFEKALEVAGVKTEEVIHIGDSLTSDVEAAMAVGITPVYLSRSGAAEMMGVRVIKSLDEMAPSYPSTQPNNPEKHHNTLPG